MIINEAKKSKLQDKFNNFEIKASPEAFKVLSTNLYQRPIESIVRELLSNAIDAVRENNDDIEIYLPTDDIKEFAIVDYGIGMNHNELIDLCTKYFSSSKQNDNSNIGGFGLGSKAPFAFTDKYFIESHKDGEHTNVLMFLGHNKAPQYLEMPCTLKMEHGTKISFECEKQMEEFYSALKIYIGTSEVFPKIKRGLDILIKDMKLLISEGEDKQKALEQHFSFVKQHYSNEKNFISMHLNKRINGQFKPIIEPTIFISGIPYEIDFDNIKDAFPKLLEKTNVFKKTANYSFYNCGFFLVANIGDIDLSPSREVLSYTDKTKNFLKRKVKDVILNYWTELLKRVEYVKDLYLIITSMFKADILTPKSYLTFNETLIGIEEELYKTVDFFKEVKEWENVKYRLIKDVASFNLIKSFTGYTSDALGFIIKKSLGPFNVLAENSSYEKVYKEKVENIIQSFKVFMNSQLRELDSNTPVIVYDRKPYSVATVHKYLKNIMLLNIINDISTYNKFKCCLIVTTEFAQALVETKIIKKEQVIVANNYKIKNLVKKKLEVKAYKKREIYGYKGVEKIPFEKFNDKDYYAIIPKYFNDCYSYFISSDFLKNPKNLDKENILKIDTFFYNDVLKDLEELLNCKFNFNVIEILPSHFKAVIKEIRCPNLVDFIKEKTRNLIVQYHNNLEDSYYMPIMAEAIKAFPDVTDIYLKSLPKESLMYKVMETSKNKSFIIKLYDYFNRVSSNHDIVDINYNLEIKDFIKEIESHFFKEEKFLKIYPMLKLSMPFSGMVFLRNFYPEVTDYVKLMENLQ